MSNYLHAFDEATPLEESMTTLNDFVCDGKTRYIGVSNFAAWQVMKAIAISNRHDFENITCIQPMYNLLKRQCESELLPMAAAEGLAVLPYGPVAGGYLTGKYLDLVFENGRFADNATHRDRYALDPNQHATANFVQFAREMGVHPASLAIAWVASHPSVTAPIIGARNPDQLATSLASFNINMSNELRSSIASMTPQPALATDRSEEQ